MPILISSSYQAVLERHYAQAWGEGIATVDFPSSTHSHLPPSFTVLALPSHPGRDVWTYATSGMSEGMAAQIELYAVSNHATDAIPEFLAAIASFHQEMGGVGPGDTVNLGKGWAEGSLCEYALISLPYLEGPSLGMLAAAGRTVHIYWLLPLTKAEVEFKKLNGLEALEAALESSGFNYLDMMRPSVIHARPGA